MINTADWQASLIEQRIAWGIASCAILITILAASQPELFDFSSGAHKKFDEAAPIVKSKAQTQTKALPFTEPVSKEKTIVKAATKTAPVKPLLKTAPVTKAASKVIKSKSTPIITKGFYVQLGAFGEKTRAQGFADNLILKGWSVKVFTKKSGLHAVWIGPKKSHTEAEKLLRNIQLKLKQKGFIVQSHS